jgi:hypothetical protein
MFKSGVKFFENDVADKLQGKLKAIAEMPKPSFERRVESSEFEDDEVEEEDDDNEPEDASDGEESFDLWWLRNDD